MNTNNLLGPIVVVGMVALILHTATVVLAMLSGLPYVVVLAVVLTALICVGVVAKSL